MLNLVNNKTNKVSNKLARKKVLTMGRATQDLRKEHDAILHVLNILDAVKPEYFRQIVDFLKIFADKCHHGKEEGYLFKELVANGVPDEGGPVGVMLSEHEQGRRYIALMDDALESEDLSAFSDAALNYRDLLRSHIEKENNVLFVIADRILDDGKQNELYDKFEQHEETVIGNGVHEKLHAMINRWSEEFPAH